MSFNVNEGLKFGKHKGKTPFDMAQVPEEAGYLQWLMDQPTDGKYKNANEDRNRILRKLLSITEPSVEQVKEEANVGLAGLSRQVVDLTMRVAALEKNVKWEE